MVRKVDVHVGHGKTGTSYLQTALALSSPSLSDQGIDYPVTDTEVGRAERGVLTRGNFTHHDRLEALNPRTEHLVLSSESLFYPLLSGSFGPELRARFPKADIRILLFVRNPVENAASSYLQAVQKGFIKCTFQEFLPRFNRPHEVSKVIDQCEANGFTLRIANFSRRRSELLTLFADWIGCSALKAPVARTVNRSLTAAEAELLTRLSMRLPRGTTNRLGSLLCAKLPDIEADKPKVSAEAMSIFRQRMKVQVEEVNRQLGAAVYDLDDGMKYISDKLQDEFTFTRPQLDIIAFVVSEAWKKSLAEGEAPAD